MSNQDQEKFILMPAELSLETATKRAEEQLAENFGIFKNMNRYCTEQELTRQKSRWIEKRAGELQDQYRALVKVVGRTSC
ncbi:hypothetical protein MMP64_12300 [Acinetobacter sp. ANC 5659]|uniref:Uncharacterized protein n=1 Tax=Acinetobacter higginsii TaxID=70347 RepID=N8XIS8_9GAMM|nr:MULTISPECIES: hypothetical protein [Acinetobacter]ENV08944.1 hypothetical protein F966_02589 [Acinetobacter higginsii]MCH7318709.1 hypothetical protein [Acinetobacter higginsii]NNP70839.1 hypothetical protein [Acinetobacter sp. Ac_5812]